MALTIGGLITEVRGVLNDTGFDADDPDDVSQTSALRYADVDLVQYVNDALLQIRAKRPDAFLGVGSSMTAAVTQYAMPGDSGTAFPLDPIFYSPVVFYVTGMAELREDTFSDDSRAVTLMNKFVSQILQVAS